MLAQTRTRWICVDMQVAEDRLQEAREQRSIGNWRQAWRFNINHSIRLETALRFTLDSVKFFKQQCCLLDTADSNYTLSEQ